MTSNWRAASRRRGHSPNRRYALAEAAEAVYSSLWIYWGSASDPERRLMIVQTYSAPKPGAQDQNLGGGSFSTGMHRASTGPCSGNRVALRTKKSRAFSPRNEVKADVNTSPQGKVGCGRKRCACLTQVKEKLRKAEKSAVADDLGVSSSQSGSRQSRTNSLGFLSDAARRNHGTGGGILTFSA